MNQYLKTVN